MGKNNNINNDNNNKILKNTVSRNIYDLIFFLIFADLGGNTYSDGC